MTCHLWRIAVAQSSHHRRHVNMVHCGSVELLLALNPEISPKQEYKLMLAQALQVRLMALKVV